MIISTKEAVLLPLIIFGFCNLQTVLSDENDASGRNKKHFSLFSVVTFKNEECSSDSTYAGGAITGTCYSTTECSDKSGTKSGNCASGFGVCCVFVNAVLASATISQNRTYIQNPLFPNVETATPSAAITYTLNRMDTDICQIRLDFDYFVIAGPSDTKEAGTVATAGSSRTNCQDMLEFSIAGGAHLPIICGVMTGLHIYMDIGMTATDTNTIKFSYGTLPAAADALRKWRIKTSQIPCWATYRAPDGCTQYYTSTTGQIVSPNFGEKGLGGTGATNKLNAGFDLLSQDMKHCIRREQNACCVQYQVCNQYDGIDLAEKLVVGDKVNGDAAYITEGWSFHTYVKDAGTNAITLDVVHNNVGLTDALCTTDYVDIPDSTMAIKSYGSAVTTFSRYCGHRLGFIGSIVTADILPEHASVWDCTAPFEVSYHTDQQDDAGLQTGVAATDPIARGLCLDFRQDMC